MDDFTILDMPTGLDDLESTQSPQSSWRLANGVSNSFLDADA
jgi:hypothetical protein